MVPGGAAMEGQNIGQHYGSDQVDQAVASGTPSANWLNRPKIIFQPVVGGVDSRGNALLRPDVQLADDQIIASDSQEVSLVQYPDEGLPPPAGLAPETAYPVDEEWMPPVVAGGCGEPCAEDSHSPFGEELGHIHDHLRGHPHHRAYVGVGREYVMHAPFFVDTTQPFNNCYVRTDYATNWEFPDRAEYFWGKTPGPKGAQFPGFTQGEKRVDYQEIDFYIERGFERFSVGTRIPIRAIDPEIRLNTTGLADMEITQKLVFLDGCRWQLTQLMSVHPPTGSFRRGTGNGHLSLEPGFAWRFKWHEDTYLHGDLTYLFPIAADPFHSGQILNHGIGISHVWIDADAWALIPTFEVDAWTVLDGRQTLPDEEVLAGALVQGEEIDSLSIVNVYPGLRWVCDKGGDCAVKEFGVSLGACVTEDHWYRGILRLEMRWSH
jgi:hypothetical protein